MTIKEVIERIKGGKCVITIVVPRKYRNQLEYNIHQPTLYMGPHVKRVRNGTTYEYGNGAVVNIRMTVGLVQPDYDLTKMKAKELTAWFKGETEVINPTQEYTEDERDTR